MPFWPKEPPLPFRTSAPKTWAAGKTSAARLHLRLIKALRSADLEVVNCDVEIGQLRDACNALRKTAEAIDAQLLVVSRLPLTKRQRELLTLRRQVDDVERAAHRIAMSAVRADGLGDVPGGLEAVKEQLDSLDAARRELANPAMPRGGIADRASAEIAKLRGRRKR